MSGQAIAEHYRILRWRRATANRTLLSEPVAYPADGFDICAEFSQLFSQTNYLDIDGALSDRVVLSFDGVNDLHPCKGPAGLAGQKVQELKLSEGQINGASAEQNFVPTGMDHEIANADRT